MFRFVRANALGEFKGACGKRAQILPFLSKNVANQTK